MIDRCELINIHLVNSERSHDIYSLYIYGSTYGMRIRNQRSAQPPLDPLHTVSRHQTLENISFRVRLPYLYRILMTNNAVK